MSAFIVSKGHIDLLVQALIEAEIISDAAADEVGRTLWQENPNSIWHRYPDTFENDADYPGPMDFSKADVGGYTYTAPAPGWGPAAVLKQIHCYDYQSCEHPGWTLSQSRIWLRVFEDHLIALGVTETSPGYDSAPWGI